MGKHLGVPAWLHEKRMDELQAPLKLHIACPCGQHDGTVVCMRPRFHLHERHRGICQAQGDRTAWRMSCTVDGRVQRTSMSHSSARSSRAWPVSCPAPLASSVLKPISDAPQPNSVLSALPPVARNYEVSKGIMRRDSEIHTGRGVVRLSCHLTCIVHCPPSAPAWWYDTQTPLLSCSRTVPDSASTTRWSCTEAPSRAAAAATSHGTNDAAIVSTS